MILVRLPPRPGGRDVGTECTRMTVDGRARRSTATSIDAPVGWTGDNRNRIGPPRRAARREPGRHRAALAGRPRRAGGSSAPARAADDPAAAPAADAALQPAPDRVRLRRPAASSARSSAMRDADRRTARSITSHPDHVRSLFTAKPEQAPSLTGESPLRPIVGPNSVLTALGAAPHAPAQTAAAALPRRGDRALRGR